MNETRHTPPPVLRLFTIAALCLLFTATGCRHAATPEDDAALTKAIQNKLAADTSLASEPIQAGVQDGVATLNGSVSNDAARSLAAADAALIVGIKTVVNNLTVQPAASSASLSTTPLVKSDRLKRREKPSPGSQSAGQTPPTASAQEMQQAAPIERQSASGATPQAPAAIRSIMLPTDTTIPVRVNTALDSATTQEGDAFTGNIASDVVVDGLIVLAQGTPVSGRVDTVHEAAHFKGSSLLTITLTNIDRRGDHLPVTTDEFSKAGNGRGKNTAEKVGGGAAIGAILGGILGGGKGAAIGAGVGGGAGAGVQAATKGQQVQIPAETLVRFHLSSPLVVRVSTGDTSHSEASPDSDLQHHDQ